ncbi:MAG: hypothetical protein M3174_00355, partial [Actinomycetota bacterium]|nr:hypothetical protein [Actinomycetota bacterium]
MTFPVRKTRLLVVLPAMLLVCAGVACTNEVEVPSTTGVVDGFVTGWESVDAEAMLQRLDEESSQQWHENELQQWLDDTLAAGGVESFEVEPGTATVPEVESEEELDGLQAEVPYTISYKSTAATEPVELEGRLDLTYEDP